MMRINLRGVVWVGIVYGLIDPRTGELRYVGETTKTVGERLSEHLKPWYLKGNTYKNNWLKELLAAGFTPTTIIIERIYGAVPDLKKAEIRYIAFYRKQGCALTNATIGGDGFTGGTHSPETRKKMSESGKRRYSDPKEVIRNSRSVGGRAVVDQHGTVYQTYQEAARAIGVDPSSISRCVKGERSIVHGYSFRYLDQPAEILKSRLKTTRPKRYDEPFQDQHGNIYHSKVEAANKHGFHWASVGACLRGKQNDVQGVAFRYLEEPTHVREERSKLSLRPGRNKPFTDQNGRIYQQQSEASKFLGVSDSLIGACLKGRVKHAKGYVFKFIGEPESINQDPKE